MSEYLMAFAATLAVVGGAMIGLAAYRQRRWPDPEPVTDEHGFSLEAVRRIEQNQQRSRHDW